MAEGMEAGMCSCDYEPWDWCDIREQKARKEHRCCECGEEIEPGETYEYVAAKYDGDFMTYKTCLPCSRIGRDFCAGIGGLREILWEALGFDYVTGEIDDSDEDEGPDQ